jgi:hypothetical protein
MADAIVVTEENFVRAETDRMFSTLQAQAGGVNQWHHSREPTSVDLQPVIRMNRDTLYSMVIADISGGSVLTVPEMGERYLSVMVVNNDHYINHIFHEPGEHPITVDQFDSPFVLVAARTLVDPEDPDDVAAVAKLQDQLGFTASSANPHVMPDYNATSFDAVRAVVLERARHADGFDRAFGSRSEVDPERHLLGAAAGWGGLPTYEAKYLSVGGDLPVGEYRVTVKDVPVDAFWSISLYNCDGYFEKNDRGAYSVNSITGTKDADGSITVHFGGDDDRPNLLPIMDGWNYTIRLYRPRPEILDGSWTFPDPEPV